MCGSLTCSSDSVTPTWAPERRPQWVGDNKPNSGLTFFSFLKTVLFYVRVPEYMCMYHLCVVAQTGQKRASDPPEPEVKALVNLGLRNGILALCKNKCSSQLSHLFGSLLIFLLMFLEAFCSLPDALASNHESEKIVMYICFLFYFFFPLVHLQVSFFFLSFF